MQQDIEPFTAPLVASEQLPPVLPKLPEPTQHGHSTFEFAIPQDVSGQAAPRSQGQPPPISSSSQPQVPPDIASSTIPASSAAAHTSTAAPVPTASTATPIPASAAAAHTSTAAPVPTASSATPIPVGAAPVAVAGAPVPFAAPDVKSVPRTTAWRRKKLAEAAQGLTPRKRQIQQQFLCQKCGQPKTKEFGHSQLQDVHFCVKASGKTVAQWMEEVKRGQIK